MLMLMLLSLLSSVPAFKACLQCDRRIRRLHEDFVLSAPTVDDQIEMKKICDHAYVTYKETSWGRKGVIGETKTRFSATCHGISFRSPKLFFLWSGNWSFYYNDNHFVLDKKHEWDALTVKYCTVCFPLLRSHHFVQSQNWVPEWIWPLLENPTHWWETKILI